MISAEKKQSVKQKFGINAYGFSNIIRNIAKQNGKTFEEVNNSDLDDYLDIKYAAKEEKNKIEEICRQNGYSGNVNYILSTVAHMHNSSCHTDDNIKNVENYFKIMQENERLAKNHLVEVSCDICGKEFVDRIRNIKHYCSNCLVETKCSICGKSLGNITTINDETKYFCSKCRATTMVQKNKSAGICSICGKHVEHRDQNARGKECGCSAKWYQEHNSSQKMVEQARKLGSIQDR